ncbi:MAG: hypothetical protein J6D04_02700 [Clostridia bacterium]|nr:hypothetical protein [Clostridia bacterium]
MEHRCLGCGRKISGEQRRTHFVGTAFHDTVCAFEWFSRSKMGRLVIPDARQDEFLEMMTEFLIEQGLSFEWFEYFKKYWR